MCFSRSPDGAVTLRTGLSLQNMTKYESFRKLTDSWKNSSDSALIYAEGDDKIILTYRNLYERIQAAPSRPEVIRTDHSPDTIVRIFADVMGGNDVILIDESTSEQTEEEIRNAFLPLLPLPRSASGISAAKGASGHNGPDSRSVASGIPETKGASGHNGPDSRSGISDNGEGRILFFTSGTTSRYRAVVLSTRALLAGTWGGQSMLACSKRDIILCLLPLSHVFGFVCGLMWGLCYRARVALGRGRIHITDDCRYFHPTILPAVPTIADLLLQTESLNRELRIMLIGAAVPSSETLRALQMRGLQTYTGYGLTETSSGLAITRDLSDPLALYICPGADIRIEPDSEITVKTEALMDGYLNPADGSLELPLVDGRFPTGDLGRIDSRGALRITGRKKDLLVLPNGEKVSCTEYEKYLSEALESDELCVILVDNRPALLFSDRLSREAVEKAVSSLNRHYPRNRQIARLIPREGMLPRTRTGKIMRWVLEK